MGKRMLVFFLALLMLMSSVSFASASGLTIEDAVLNSDGSVTISWSDPDSSGPYMVYYMYTPRGGDESFEGQVWREYDDPTSRKSITMEQMVPGECYWILVEDSAGNTDVYLYQPQKTKFQGLQQMRTRIIPRRQWGGSAETLDAYSASAIEKACRNNDNAFGASIKVNYTDAPRNKKYTLRVAMYMPSGEPITLHVEEATLVDGTGENYSYWPFFNMDWLWRTMLLLYDQIPQGTYTIGLFINDGYAGFQDVVMKR